MRDNDSIKPILQCENVTHTIRREYSKSEETLFENVSICLKQNDFILLRGDSGVGKTTILKIFAGLVKPKSGTVNWGEKEVYPKAPKNIDRLRGKSIGFIFQEPNLIPHLTAWENIALPAILSRMEKEEVEIRVKKLAKICGIENKFLKQRARYLSGGEKERVNIARAFVCGPRIILADEILASLDQSLKEKIWPGIKKECKYNKIGFVAVSHSSFLYEDRDFNTRYTIKDKKVEMEK